ncbi:hypothetical protein KC207_12760 [Phycicoccus sp. BSK3Z-2]|uniref:Uncharacterized protein n=1 Tax=Phycicoccus avicenniae TaxID=2828860 RepID=A0A941HZJ5_9MICO|nr:hypothetical protein [Phycicoccus avicenniae]MBR7744158.1 hypothetical protein [Phycicoccus avicenniae]
MSHWHSGLPKLDIKPFDPTPLYDAVRVTAAENRAEEAARRGRRRPYVISGVVFAVAVALGAAFAMMV